MIGIIHKHINFIILIFIVITIITAQHQKIASVPGYPSTFSGTAYSGYLDTGNPLRKLHFIFLESATPNLPVTLWLNGGPGCSSKMGFLQQIGPYFLQINKPYNLGDQLKFNQHSWFNLSNLLFIQAPAGVGFSVNNDTNFKYNDINTAKDNLQAIKNFFWKEFPSYNNTNFYIAGQSYAGKYIPDLAVQIDNYNTVNPKQLIPLKGILIANGVLNFKDNSLIESQVEHMIQHNLVDPKLVQMWKRSCIPDKQSAGCTYFYTRYDDLLHNVDGYNIYGPCYGSQVSEKNFLKRVAQRFTQRADQAIGLITGYFCSYDEGVQNYFKDNYDKFFSTIKQFKICNDKIFQTYDVTPSGSMQQMSRILLDGHIKVFLFNGDWDNIVPFNDTYKNLKLLSLKLESSEPWILDGQHAGFIKKFTSGSAKLNFFIVKGAGHEVPQYKRRASYDLFEKFINA